MERKKCCWVRYLFIFVLLLSHLCFSCTRKNTSADHLEMQQRFDSAYHFVVNNMVMSYTQLDTFLILCDKMMSMPPSGLAPRQLPAWAHSFALSASMYMNNNELKKAIVCLQRGIEVADSLGNLACLSRASNLLALIYSNWKLEDEANTLFNKVMAYSAQSDVLSRANAYLAKSMHMVYTEKYDSASYYMSLIDRLQLTEEDMLSGSYRSVQYLTRLLKGWYLTETPDSLECAIGILQGLYDEYYPVKEGAVSFETVCFRLGRAYDLAGDEKRAARYYNESKDMIMAQPVSYQLFEVANPLMDTYLRKNDKVHVLEFMPVWRHICEQYYDYRMNGLLAYYSVKLDVAGKEKKIIQAEDLLAKRRMEVAILTLTVMLLLILVVGGIVYWRNKKRQLRRLFEALMRRYIEWREINLYLASNPKEVYLFSVKPDEGNSADKMDAEGLSSDETKNDDFYRELYYRVLLVMEKERPFLNPELNMLLLAKAVMTNRTYLSTAINRMTGSSFSMWLAEYRVNYVIQQMENGGFNSMDELYEQAGFGSKTSFYRQFKQITGLTPKQFIKRSML